MDYIFNDETTIDAQMLRLESGQVIDKYRLVEKAGRGGMGVVWKAYDTVGERYVALKFVPEEIRYRDEAMTQVKDVFLRIHTLRHQNICPVLALEKDATLGYYIVMEWLDGVSLDRLIKSKEWNKDFIFPILKAVAEALDYAHSKKVLHRDVKPSNIFVRLDNGKIKEISLIDFGLAIEIHSTLSRYSNYKVDTSGTRLYMPPEQWIGDCQTGKTDQYALGVVAYELYAGFLPFQFSDIEMLKLAVLNNKPRTIANIPVNIDNAIQKALSKNISDRFSSCKEFIVALTLKQTIVPRLNIIISKLGNKTGWIVAGVAVILLAFVVIFSGREQKKKETVLSSVSENVPEVMSESVVKKIVSPPESSAEALFSVQETVPEVVVEEVVSPSAPPVKESEALPPTPAEFFKYKINFGKVTIVGFIGENYPSTEVRIPEKIEGCPVTEIGKDAFRECRDLTSVTIPGSVTVIEFYAFADCVGLTSVTIPEGVTVIKQQAFKDCISLTSITIPESMSLIETWAFHDCTGLTSVTIPKNVMDVQCGAFSGCTGLREIKVSPENPNYKSIEGVLFTKDEKILVAYPTGGKEEYAIPEGTREIGNLAFDNCINLVSITIPESVTKIGGDSFTGCTGLTSILIPENVSVIGGGAFSRCTGLTSVTIPKSVMMIGNLVFNGCTSLREIKVSPDNPNYKSIEGVLFTKDGKILVAFPVGRDCKEYSIPEGMTVIKNRMFSGRNDLTVITIPEGVTEIENEAFFDCPNLMSVTIPKSVTRIGDRAFWCCHNLTSITIPENVTRIGVATFVGCHNLVSVRIPEGVTVIEMGAFSDCTGLMSITIPESVTEIKNGAFNNCLKLRIQGKKGSRAEQYAKENRIHFETY